MFLETLRLPYCESKHNNIKISCSYRFCAVHSCPTSVRKGICSFLCTTWSLYYFLATGIAAPALQASQTVIPYTCWTTTITEAILCYPVQDSFKKWTISTSELYYKDIDKHGKSGTLEYAPWPTSDDLSGLEKNALTCTCRTLAELLCDKISPSVVNCWAATVARNIIQYFSFNSKKKSQTNPKRCFCFSFSCLLS